MNRVHNPYEEKLGYNFQSETCLGALESYILHSFRRLILCKWPEINLSLVTLKIAMHKVQTNGIFSISMNEILLDLHV